MPTRSAPRRPWAKSASTRSACSICGRYGNYIALVFVAAVLACIAILPDMRMSLLVSAAWVGIVYVAYRFYTKDEKAVAQNLAGNA